MSSNYPPPSGIGNISTALGQFAQGWQNAKAQGRDREEQERRRNQEHANNLLQVLDSPIAQNPSMKASLMEAYADALDKAEAGPQKKKKQEGIGGLVKRMFGGGYDAVPDTQPGPMRAALNKSEVDRQSQIRQETFHGPAREEGRGDYGTSGLANFLGPAAANPISTQTPNAPMSRETVKPSAFPQTPDEQMSKVSAAPAPSPVAQYATAPRTPQSPQQSAATAQYANNYISPDKLVRSATVAHTGKYGIQDTGAIQRDVMTQAHAIINDLLDHVDSFIDVTPGHETLEQAYAHPQIRQALDGIRDYAHLTGQKFEDIVGSRFAKDAAVPKFSLVKDAIGPDGKPVLGSFNESTGGITPSSVRQFENSPDEAKKLENDAIVVYRIPEAQRTPEQNQVIAAYEAHKGVGQTWTPDSITVDGKGPIAVLKNSRGDYVDATTRLPITGKIGVYERPRESDIDIGIHLTPEALDVAARRYLQDGTLPPMGMGSKSTTARQEIMNRAAILDPNAAIAANKATYQADSAALSQLTKSVNAVESFEKTGQANLNQFVNLAKRVRDTGSPWLNRPLRSMDRNLLGSTDQAAYDAARQVALTEIARIVANPNLTGVLSDSARRETESFSPDNATLAQTLRISEVLLQDMKNRIEPLKQQQKQIQDSLRNGPPISGTLPNAPGSGFSFQYQGKTLTFPTEAAMKAAKAAAGVK